EAAVAAQGVSRGPARATQSALGTYYYAHSLSRLGGTGTPAGKATAAEGAVGSPSAPGSRRPGGSTGAATTTAAAGAGVTAAAGWLLDRAVPAPFVLAPFLAALVVAFARVGDESICDGFPTLARFAVRAVTGRHRWFAELPFIGAVIRPAGATVDLPPLMAGL